MTGCKEEDIIGDSERTKARVLDPEICFVDLAWSVELCLSVFIKSYHGWLVDILIYYSLGSLMEEWAPQLYICTVASLPFSGCFGRLWRTYSRVRNSSVDRFCRLQNITYDDCTMAPQTNPYIPCLKPLFPIRHYYSQFNANSCTTNKFITFLHKPSFHRTNCETSNNLSSPIALTP